MSFIAAVPWVRHRNYSNTAFHVASLTLYYWRPDWRWLASSLCYSCQKGWRQCEPLHYECYSLSARLPYPFPFAQCGVSPREWLALGSPVPSESGSASGQWVHLRCARAGSRTRFLFGSPRAENKAPTNNFRDAEKIASCCFHRD